MKYDALGPRKGTSEEPVNGHSQEAFGQQSEKDFLRHERREKRDFLLYIFWPEQVEKQIYYVLRWEAGLR